MNHRQERNGGKTLLKTLILVPTVLGGAGFALNHSARTSYNTNYEKAQSAQVLWEDGMFDQAKRAEEDVWRYIADSKKEGLFVSDEEFNTLRSILNNNDVDTSYDRNNISY